MRRASNYQIELTAHFTFTVEETVSGPAGLTHVGVEEIIERNWWWISSSTDVLLESGWELDAFEELPDGCVRG